MLIIVLLLCSLLSGVVAGFTCGDGWYWVAPVTFVSTFVSLAALVFLALVILCALVDLKKPQQHDSKLYRFVATVLCDAAYPLLSAKLHTTGTEQIPTNGRFLLVCNHINDMDPVTLLKAFPNSQLAFISKRENSSMFLVGKFTHKMMGQLINRENDREALITIKNCIRLLQEDEVSIAVFPEGYTSMDGLLRHFRNGVFKIAQRTNVPIVVCTLQNTNKIFKNAPKLRRTDVQLHLLRVIAPEEYEGMSTAQISDMVYTLMAEDLGPELVYQGEES